MSEEKVTLGDVVTPRRDKGAPSDNPELPFIGLEHIEAHTMQLLGTVPAGTMRSNANRFYAGDVLYARLRPYLNKVYSPNFDGYCSAEFIVFPKTEWIDSTFLKHRLNARDFVSFASHLNAGDRPRVDFDQLSSFAFFLPSSLPAQRAIVAKIEELFSELDKSIEALKTAREQLKVYRQALLKHAFEGKLTAAWRAANPDKLEPAAALLARIQTEREQRHQQQLQQWQTNGGSKPKAPKPLPPLSAEDLAELPELPEGWGWTRFGSLDIDLKRGPFGSSITKSMFVPSGFKVYEQGNAIYRDSLRGSYFINEAKYEELSGFSVSPGDFIVSCAGTVGRIYELPENSPPGVINQALMRVRINDAILNRYFFATLFESAFFQRKVLSDAKGTAMVNLAGIKELNLVPVAICGLEEQAAINELVETRLSEADQLDQTLATSLQQSEALRQSILKRAFSGQLVAQDPHDEPAAVLLARIRAEHESGGKRETIQRRTKKVSA